MCGGQNDIEKAVLLSLCKKLIKGKYLEEEDLLILENLSPAIQELNSQLLENVEALDKDSSFPEISWNKIFSSCESFYISLAFVLFTAITMTFTDLSTTSALFSLFLLSAAVIIIRAFQIYMDKSCLLKLNELLHITQNANQVSTKCLRYLFEMDILKRGLGPKHNSDLENGFEECVSYGLSQLQTSLFSYFKSLREEIRNFSKKISDLRNVHILFNKRFELIDCSASNENTFVKAKTEKCEVSSAISSFWTETLLLYETLETLRLFNTINWKKIDNLKLQTQLLEKNLNLAKKFWLNEKSNLKHLIDSPKSYENLKTDVAGAVDILSVKCKLLAYYSVYLQESLVNCDNNDNLPYDLVRQTCNEIRSHVLSCNASLEDVLERTENLYSVQFGSPIKEKHEHHQTKEFDDIKSESISLTNTHINLNDLKPHVIQDEVFEAVVEDSQSRSLIFEDDEWLQNLKQEKQMKKKQKDRCKRVLQEIQPILHKRREMWEERESKALNRMRNVTDEDESPINIKESDSGVSSPLEIQKNCFENKKNSPTKLMSLYGSSMKSVLDEEQDCDGYDSEEERLLVYKRVKRELDMDEEKRRWENDTDTEDDVDDNVKENCTEIKDLLKLPLKLSPENKSEFNQNINEMSSTSLHSNLKESFLNKLNAPSGESGSFSCGESSDNDDAKVIDWSSCGFRNLKSVENENSNIKACFTGFSLPALNKEVIKPPALVEEVFGGFGEGESDEEKSCSDDDSLNSEDKIKE